MIFLWLVYHRFTVTTIPFFVKKRNKKAAKAANVFNIYDLVFFANIHNNMTKTAMREIMIEYLKIAKKCSE